jgi:hypothetical protein
MSCMRAANFIVYKGKPNEKIITANYRWLGIIESSL